MSAEISERSGHISCGARPGAVDATAIEFPNICESRDLAAMRKRLRETQSVLTQLWGVLDALEGSAQEAATQDVGDKPKGEEAHA